MTSVVEEFFGATVTVVGHTAIIDVRGDLDGMAVPHVRDLVSMLDRRDVRHLVVDLQDCQFVDRAGAALLARENERCQARGAVLSVRAPSRHVQRQLRDSVGGAPLEVMA